MNNKLIELVEEIKLVREDDEPVKRAWLNSCQRLGLQEEEPIILFGLMLSNHPDLINSINPYHNHLHAADVITSASFLAKEEFTNSDLIKEGVILLLSMMVHDVAHNGKHNEFDYQLEKEAISSFRNYIEQHPEMRSYWSNRIEHSYGNLDGVLDKMESIVLGTDFKIAPLMNLKHYVEDDHPSTLTRLKLLANEADVLPSCIACFGPALGKKLSEEQNNPSINSWKNRAKFLRNSVKFGSFASKVIGIKEHINNQLDAIRSLGVENLETASTDEDFECAVAKVCWRLENNKNPVLKR